MLTQRPQHWNDFKGLAENRPIASFDSCLELVQAMKDAIEGHRDAYKAGVLHRDISISNILIFDECDKRRTKEVGVLIDFDNGISLKPDRLSVNDDQLSGTTPFVSAELLSRSPYFVKEVDLDLLDDEQLMSDPAGQPGISTSVILFHCWLHDLESFFWVLLWCCISRGGPGGMRRPELWSNTPAEKPLRESFRQLFEHATLDGMASFKWRLLNHQTYFRDMLHHTSTYCKILNPLLADFYKILRRAFKEGNHTSDLVNTVHDEVVAAFAKTEARSLALNKSSAPVGDSSNHVKREDASHYAPTNALSKAKIPRFPLSRGRAPAPCTPHRRQSSRKSAASPLPSPTDP
ncbi:hypothetical protein K474DRAFT_1711526 [Panus rudis PR-1116 ss-1]|nr:hypothetical protein K474DRAFT_1711526 [Panus rudis PR-1116 ss-1]